MLVDDVPISASLFDAGLYLFHNAAERVARGSGPYLYLPKLESHHEARLWNEVFVCAQARARRPARVGPGDRPHRDHHARRSRWTRSCTSCASTPRASTPAAGTTCSASSSGSTPDPDFASPDRAQLTMTLPFMRAYTELLVATCHRRGAHAIGGMAAFIPNRRDPEVTTAALAKVRDDKERESGDGFDGTWVAHPDLVPVATGGLRRRPRRARPNQKDRLRDDVDAVGGDACATSACPMARSPRPASAANVRVALAYLDAWLRGTGAAAIDNLMEDAATAEISRSQLWLWRTRGDAVAERYADDPRRGAGPARWRGDRSTGRRPRPAGPTSSSTTPSPTS